MSDDRVIDLGINSRNEQSASDYDRDRRLTALERHFDIAMAKVAGVELVVKVSAYIIIAIISSFIAALLWFAQQRNDELTKLSDSLQKLTIISSVQGENLRSMGETLLDNKAALSNLTKP